MQRLQLKVTLGVNLGLQDSTLSTYQLVGSVIFLFLSLHPAVLQGCAAKVILVY